MSKYALSFSTQGNDLNTYYLAASILGMVSHKYSSNSANISNAYGFTSITYAKEFQTCIDGVFTDKSWQTDPCCYAAAKTYSPTALSDNAIKTATSVAYSTSSGSTSNTMFSGLSSWLVGSGSSAWTNVAKQSIPYINYKISCMSETDFMELVTSVIRKGNFTDYEQTNSPVQE